MTTFLLLCAVMIVAALAIMLVPLLRNVPAEGKDAKVAPRAVPAAVALMVVLPLAASAFYGATSNFPWDNPGAVAGQGAGHAQDGGSMAEVMAQLEERLAKNPGDAEGWRMLGRTYLVSGRAEDAVKAYEKAIQLTGSPDGSLELDLAEALVLTDRPEAKERAKGIIDAALAADANSQKALWYSGVLAVRGNDPETAKKNWSKLLEQDPPPEIREILVQQLAELGVAAPAAAGAPAAPPPGMGGGMAGMGAAAVGATEATGRTIRIAVSVDPAAGGQAQAWHDRVRQRARSRDSGSAARRGAHQQRRVADHRRAERCQLDGGGSQPVLGERSAGRGAGRVRGHGGHRQRRSRRRGPARQGRSAGPRRRHQQGFALGSWAGSCSSN